MVVEEQAAKPKGCYYSVGHANPAGNTPRFCSRAAARANSISGSPVARSIGVDASTGRYSAASGQRDQVGAEAQAEGIG